MKNENTNKVIETTNEYGTENIRSKKAMFFIWLFPVIIILIVAYTLLKQYQSDKLVINFILRDAKNVEVGTKIKYRGILIGDIKKVYFDLKKHVIIATARMSSKHVYSYTARKGNKFKIQKIKVTLGGIKNIQSVFKGADIVLYPSTTNTTKLLDEPVKDLFVLDDSDYDYSKNYIKSFYITLYGKNTEDIPLGSAIEYKGLEIGNLKNRLIKDDKVSVQVEVNAKYKYLFARNIYFYKTAIFQLKLDQSGFDFNLKSLNAVNKAIEVGFSSYAHTNSDNKNEFYLFTNNKFINSDIININLSSPSVSSIVPNHTLIKYKGMIIGKIGAYKYDDRSNTFKINTLIYKKYRDLIKEDASFSLVKPSISMKGVKGLDTLLLGTYINLKKGRSSRIATNFVLNKVKMNKNNRINITFDLKELHNIQVGSKITYRDVNVGEVTDYKLFKDGIEVKAFIYKDYKKYIDRNSRFYISPLFRAKFSFKKGVDMNINSKNALKDNIAILPYNNKASVFKGIKNNSTYKLYSSVDDASTSLFIIYLTNDNVVANEGSPVLFKNYKIGTVLNIDFDDSYHLVYKIGIYNRFKKLVYKSSKFVKTNSLKVNFGLFSGLKMNFSSLKDIVLGGINLEIDNKANRVTAKEGSTFKLYDTYK